MDPIRPVLRRLGLFITPCEPCGTSFWSGSAEVCCRSSATFDRVGKFHLAKALWLQLIKVGPYSSQILYSLHTWSRSNYPNMKYLPRARRPTPNTEARNTLRLGTSEPTVLARYVRMSAKCCFQEWEQVGRESEYWQKPQQGHSRYIPDAYYL